MTSWTHYDDATASLENFNNRSRQLSAITFFCGHGFADNNGGVLEGGNDLAFLNGATCEHSNTFANYPNIASTMEFTLGGLQTKWAFFDCCLGLYDENPNDYTPIFTGAHAIFGFQSDTYWWDDEFIPSSFNTYGSDRYKYLWANWVQGQQTMWTAWSNALVQNYANVNNVQPGQIPGTNFAVVFPFGHAYNNDGTDWEYISGAGDVINNTFLKQMSMNPLGGTDWYPQGMCYYNTVIGNPTY
jgi:hypothetical protein